MCSDVRATPKEDQEAEEVALWLSGSLVAPETLYSRVQADLAEIRSTYGGSIPALMSVFFRPWWVVSELQVSLADTAIEQFLQGNYHDLDDLNGQLGLTRMEHYVLNWITLSFQGRLNPAKLAELYERVPSVVEATPVGPPGDSPTIYPWLRVEPE
jgi:hypothetical protein